MIDPTKHPHYSGLVHPNSDYHHGQIKPTKGVKNYQVARANRSGGDDGSYCTYKHASDIAYFEGHYYVHYLVNPADEHTKPGFSILTRSNDGIIWDHFDVSFPVYNIPDCTITDYKGQTHHLNDQTDVYMHQRMSFYQSPTTGRMLISGFYGWSPHPWMTNWDNYGIGRVVRELHPNGSLGPIYFIAPNWQAGWKTEQLQYPLYDTSTDLSFISLCKELLADRLFTQQWAEENGDKSDIIQIKHPVGSTYQAFTWYHIDEQTIIGLWKHALVARSDDNGASWSDVKRSPSLVMSGQKVWAERTTDGGFAMVYNPTLETQHRYPLCVTTSKDGLNFSDMRLVHGEVSPMRFKGFWKDMGPQYVRGISEGNALPPDGDLWLSYSVNKEDIWVSRVPVPIVGDEHEAQFTESFADAAVLDNWNIYSPVWAPVRLEETVLRLRDSDRYDYARVERLLKTSKNLRFDLRLSLHQVTGSNLQIELLNAKGIVALRLVFRPDGMIYARTVTEIPVASYEAGCIYDLSVDVDCEAFTYTLSINGDPICDEQGSVKRWLFMSAVNDVCRLSLRTGDARHAHSLDYDPEGKPEEPLPLADVPETEAIYDIHALSVDARKRSG